MYDVPARLIHQGGEIPVWPPGIWSHLGYKKVSLEIWGVVLGGKLDGVKSDGLRSTIIVVQYSSILYINICIYIYIYQRKFG